MAGRPFWVRVAGGRRVETRVTPRWRAQVRVTHRPPPPPLPVFGPPQRQNPTAHSSHIAQTISQGPRDHTLKTVESLVKRCSGGGVGDG
jgi:hypothetical protein